MRPLVAADYHKQYRSLLAQLTNVGTLSEAYFTRTLQIHSDDPLTFIYVIEDTARGRIVGALPVLRARVAVAPRGVLLLHSRFVCFLFRHAFCLL